MRQLKGKVKKESKKEKRERKKDFLENKQKVFTVVLPTVAVITILVICYILYMTKYWYDKLMA